MSLPKRLFDVISAIVAILLLAPLLLIIAILVKLTSPGPVLHWSDRVGVRNRIVRMPKFRSMRVNTPQLATHLMQSPEAYLTPIGSFLRRFSIDELPQFWSILRGDLSVVGPRPALFNQYDLTDLRSACGVHSLVPGLTGWAQVNGRDELSLLDKVRFDRIYLEQQSFFFDCRIVLITAVQALAGKDVHH